MTQEKVLIGVVMGSDSDWPTMQAAALLLKEFSVPFEAKVVSAHRTPDLLFEYAETAAARGLQAIIAGAGGADRPHPGPGADQAPAAGHDGAAAEPGGLPWLSNWPPK